MVRASRALLCWCLSPTSDWGCPEGTWPAAGPSPVPLRGVQRGVVSMFTQLLDWMNRDFEVLENTPSVVWGEAFLVKDARQRKGGRYSVWPHRLWGCGGCLCCSRVGAPASRRQRCRDTLARGSLTAAAFVLCVPCLESLSLGSTACPVQRQPRGGPRGLPDPERRSQRHRPGHKLQPRRFWVPDPQAACAVSGH